MIKIASVFDQEGKMSQTPLTTAYTEATSSALSRSAYSHGAGDAALSKISTGAQTLPEGSKINAKVVDFLGRDLSLRLSDGTVLHANTSTAVSLSIGQTADFEVLRSNGEQLLLKLVSETPQEASASLAGRALTAAGLPVNEGNISLVNALLSNRMPVNAENLQALVHEANVFRDAPAETLVMMHKYGMPVNNTTISQFQAYASFEHEVMPMLSDLFDSLSSAEFVNALSNGENAPAGDAAVQSTSNSDTVAVPGGEGTDFNASGNIVGSNGNESTIVSLTPESTSRSMAEVQNAVESNSIVGKNAEVINTVGAESAASPEGTVSDENTAGITEETSAGFVIGKDGFIDAKTGEPISFKDRWTLTPEQLQKPGTPEKLYEQLHKDLTVLKSAIKKAREKNPDAESELGKMLSQAADTAKKLLDNLDFMNVLNRYFPYIQLPMRMEEKFTNGELYVYTKKGGEKQGNEASSVLLHLDMEQLGPTDIFLSLAGTQLKAKFYLADDETEKLFSDHLTELTERLEKLGLSCNYEFLSQKEAEQPVHDFLAAPEAVEMKRYRFDRRA